MNAHMLLEILAYTAIPLTLALTAYRYLLRTIAAGLGLRGKDMHKPYEVMVDETGGIGLYIGIMALFTVSTLLGDPHAPYILLSSTLLFLAGIVDDLVRLDGATKVALTATASIPLLLDTNIKYTLLLPFIGNISLKVLYPAIIVIAITVSSNMFNMADTLNGTMLIAAFYTTLAMITYIAYTGNYNYIPLMIGFISLILLGLKYNLYPASFFNGDTGSLTLGGTLAALSIITKTETVFLLVTLPLVLNGFQILSSIRGFKEKSAIPRPVVIKNGCIYASRGKKRGEEPPVTLIQLLVLRKCLKEHEAITAFSFIMLVSFITAIASILLTLPR